MSDQSHLVSFYSSGYYPSTTGLSIAALLLLLCHCNDILAAAAASQHYFEEKIALLSYSYIRLEHDRRKEGNKKKKRKQGTRLPFFLFFLFLAFSGARYRPMVCRVSEEGKSKGDDNGAKWLMILFRITTFKRTVPY